MPRWKGEDGTQLVGGWDHVTRVDFSHNFIKEIDDSVVCSTVAAPGIWVSRPLTLSLSRPLTLSLSHPFTLTAPSSHSHCLVHSLSLSRPLSHCPILSLSPCPVFSLSHCPVLSLSRSFSSVVVVVCFVSCLFVYCCCLLAVLCRRSLYVYSHTICNGSDGLPTMKHSEC